MKNPITEFGRLGARGLAGLVLALAVLLATANAIRAHQGERAGFSSAGDVRWATENPRGQDEGGMPVGDTIDLRTLGYARGSMEAPLVVYEFSDFGCPFCGKFALGMYPELHREFVATGKVRWVHVPFVMGMFPNGAEAARAAECAGEQERFWPMHDLLFQRQNEWKRNGETSSLFAGYARRTGLDVQRFDACYRENRRGRRTEMNNRAADAVGIRATPSFLINGRLVEGALPAEQFRRVLTLLGGAK